MNYRDYSAVSNTWLRGHEMKLLKGGFNTTIRKNSFSQRVTDHWNNLSYDVVALHVKSDILQLVDPVSTTNVQN